ncbi:hypothetical protein BGZ98_005606 [Dissophora globulifera]|nr:hypothetical protein BGZ98_005606 [Dissophora globulifera]
MSLQGCACLTKIIIQNWFSNHTVSAKYKLMLTNLPYRLANLVEANSGSLTHLVINTGQHQMTISDDLLLALLQCSFLTELEITSAVVPKDNLELLLGVCAIVRTLKLESVKLCRLPQELFKQEAGIMVDNEERSSQTLLLPEPRHIKLSLQVGIDDTYDAAMGSYEDQALILRSCTNLNTLAWSGGVISNGRAPTTKFLTALSADPWPLHRLECIDLLSDEFEDEAVARLLAQMDQLRSLKVSSGLGILSFKELIKEADKGVRGQYQRHCNTIEELWVETCYSLTSDKIQALLERCPNLHTLIASKIKALDIVRGKEWACRKMKRLRVCVEVDDSEGKSGGDVLDTSATPVYASKAGGSADGRELFWDVERMIFSRLGALIHLQELHLTKSFHGTDDPPRTLNLKLGHGLELLVNLKCLRKFDCSTDYTQKLSLVDVRWMVEHWTALEWLGCFVDCSKRATFLGIQTLLILKKIQYKLY